MLKRKHLLVDEYLIKYIEKETNELEISNILGTIKSIEYDNRQKNLRRIVTKLTEETAKEIGISRRMYYYLKKKLHDSKPINLKDKTLKKILS